MNRSSQKAQTNSIILIGMPGAGKSTLGSTLAKTLVKTFVDTDQLIEQQTQKKLQDIVNHQGYMALRQIEENFLLNSHYTDHIIATGGSAVYSQAAMEHLGHLGLIIFLDVAQAELERRIHNMDSRGLARQPEQSFSSLFNERRPLYLQYANVVIDCNHKTPQQILDEIICYEGIVYSEMDA